MKLFKKNLILNIGAAVLLIEFLALASFGFFYTERFSNEVDRFLEDNIQLPGKLMNRQLLRYESVSDREVMTELVGDEFLDGMIVGADGQIFYAYNDELVGKSIFNILEASTDLLSNVRKEQILIRKTDSNTIVSITPLIAFEGAKPFFHVYIKASTREAQARKESIAALFIFGSGLCIFLSSLAIIWYSRYQFTQPLNALKESADALRRGDLDVEIPVGRDDELGSLAHSLASMRNAIKEMVLELKDTNLNLQDKERRLRALVEAFPDRIILFDWDGRFVDVYAVDRNDVTLSSQDMIGKTLHDVHQKRLADRALKAIQDTISTGVSQEHEYSLDGNNGKVWFESRTSRIGDEDGEGGQIIWVARDITYRKDIERRLTRAKDDAEQVSMRLRELDQTKSALVSSVSHELRTPLTSLLGFSQLILKNFSTHFWPLAKGNHKRLIKGAQIVENLNILILEGNRLTRLINDVLDLNKIEMGYTEWREENINPAELARNAAQAVSGQFANNSSLSLTTEIDDNLPEITVDADRMLQVLLNLLTNAAKFTPAGLVTLRASTPTPDTIRFEVSDTGPGIPAHEKERIFEIFHQASHIDPADHKPHGAGLGLAISREIIEHYNGTIKVESEEGHGATFIIELPVQ